MHGLGAAVLHTRIASRSCVPAGLIYVPWGLQGHVYTPISVVWSTDGRLLASTDAYDSVRIWNATTGALIVALPITAVRGPLIRVTASLHLLCHLS